MMMQFKLVTHENYRDRFIVPDINSCTGYPCNQSIQPSVIYGLQKMLASIHRCSLHYMTVVRMGRLVGIIFKADRNMTKTNLVKVVFKNQMNMTMEIYILLLRCIGDTRDCKQIV